MLRDLTIQNYRAFKDFTIDGLARVNLIVGANNSGKTSFLEAVYLLVNQVNPAALLEVLDNRGEYVIDFPSVDSSGDIGYQTAHIFHGHDPQSNPLEGAAIEISTKRDQDMALKMHVVGDARSWAAKQAIGQISGQDISEFELAFEYQFGMQLGHLSLSLLADYSYVMERRLSRAREQVGPYRFVTANTIDFNYLSALWDSIIQTSGKEEVIVQALRILEPSIEDVRFSSRRTAGGVLVRLRDQPQRIPLSSMGDGLRRILALVASAVSAEAGLLLVDEIDTGLYHGAQTEMWRLLIQTAQQHNVQIFATTHSWDCVQAFEEALEASEPGIGRLFRLEDRQGAIRPVIYEADELAVAVREIIEVR